jgi:hypothetical protein
VVPSTIIPSVTCYIPRIFHATGSLQRSKVQRPKHTLKSTQKGLTSGPEPRPHRELQKPSPAFGTLDFVGALTPLLRERSSLWDTWRGLLRAHFSHVAFHSAFSEGCGRGLRH